jgi:hypothetical protein
MVAKMSCEHNALETDFKRFFCDDKFFYIFCENYLGIFYVPYIRDYGLQFIPKKSLEFFL